MFWCWCSGSRVFVFTVWVFNRSVVVPLESLMFDCWLFRVLVILSIPGTSVFSVFFYLGVWLFEFSIIRPSDYPVMWLFGGLVLDLDGSPVVTVPQILLQNKFLEQQQVGEMAMLPPSEARERLYRLLKDRCRLLPVEKTSLTPTDLVNLLHLLPLLHLLKIRNRGSMVACAWTFRSCHLITFSRCFSP